MMFLLHGPPGVPSCIPSDSKSGIMKAAYQGNTDTLQANVKEGLATEFCRCFTHKEKQENEESEETVFLCKSDCLNSSVDWTFETDGVYTVSVNASSIYRLMQETIDAVLACLVVSDLREPGNQLTVSKDVELLNTVKHRLILNLTKDDRNYENYRNLSSKEKDCNHGNITYDSNISQHLICCHVNTLHLLHTSDLSSCHLHLHLHILVQDPVGKLALNIPSEATRNLNPLVLFSITAASNVTVCLLANARSLYRNCSYATGAETEVVLLFNHTGTVVIEFQTENRVFSQNRSARACVQGNRKASPQDRINPTCQPTPSPSPVHSIDGKAVRILAAKQAYPTNTDITFLAVADVPDPVEFLWRFGDSRSARTTSRTITKRYQQPGSYDVVVVASHGQTSVTSDAFPLVVQRAVKLNRLVHQASVLQNQTVSVSCRVNVGTDLTFLWSFGDGTTRPGQSTEEHVFHRLGEFRLEVTVSNMVSSASLSSCIFVVGRPCWPPPVKNMGPLKLQVRRYQVIRLGVTYETEVDCDVSEGLNYTWTLFDSTGRTFPLPLIDTHRQSLTLQSHLLPYDTYTAISRVQVIGSVVYSNYSVRVQVIPSPPVVFIQGGTNIFMNRSSGTVTLDGQASYDPDFPMNPLSYSWTCKPVSSIASSCFNQHVHTSSPVLKFHVGFLKHNFDQFQFTLTIHSGERSASSETFITITPNLIRRMSVSCPECHGDHVSWDQTFSVTAMCEDCNIPAEHIQYSWSVYVVNASSKPVTEVPFCSTVDLSAFSSIVENPATSAQTPEISTLHPSVASSHSSLSESEPSNSPPVLSIASSDHTDQEDITSEPPADPGSSTYWDFSFPVLESVGEGDRQGEKSSTEIFAVTFLGLYCQNQTVRIKK
ncbi:polycystic kidney disease 1 like 1-like [Amphiprion ocellaris]|uniref:polycystic kidney disease 1 like 1-like n=1 Tax=Amphiprion ocellaris TaxID=80972 RepID=UPI0024111472|nr:polycystic kidney disease 1 like 1-like [Amphiprion ocellaris]